MSEVPVDSDTSHASSPRPSRITTLLAFAGGLVGLASGAVHVANYLSERPRLVPAVDRMELRTDKEERDVAEQLGQIEEAFGQSTGFDINKLRSEALGINFDTDTAAAETFSNSLQQAIQKYDKAVQPLKAEDVKYDNGVAIIPDGTRLDILHGPLSLIMPADARTAIEANPANPDAAAIQQVKDKIVALAGNNVDEQANRRQIAERLRRLRIQLADRITKSNRRLVVELIVKNESRMPNVLMDRALVRIFHGTEAAEDIPVRLRQNEVLPGYSASRLVFESERIATFDESKRDFINNAFTKEYSYIFVTRDLHGNIRGCSGMLAQAGPDARIRDLVEFANAEIKKDNTSQVVKSSI